MLIVVHKRCKACNWLENIETSQVEYSGYVW